MFGSVLGVFLGPMASNAFQWKCINMLTSPWISYRTCCGRFLVLETTEMSAPQSARKKNSMEGHLHNDPQDSTDSWPSVKDRMKPSWRLGGSRGNFETRVTCHICQPRNFETGGIPTPLKNMSSSVGVMKFPIYGKSYNSCSKPPTSALCVVQDVPSKACSWPLDRPSNHPSCWGPRGHSPFSSHFQTRLVSFSQSTPVCTSCRFVGRKPVRVGPKAKYASTAVDK